MAEFGLKKAPALSEVVDRAVSGSFFSTLMDAATKLQKSITNAFPLPSKTTALAEHLASFPGHFLKNGLGTRLLNTVQVPVDCCARKTCTHARTFQIRAYVCSRCPWQQKGTWDFYGGDSKCSTHVYLAFFDVF